MLTEYKKISYNGDILTDISKRFIIKNIETNYSRDIYFEYIIENWKSPENIAYDFYGSCDYVWLILTVNNIVDPVGDWLLQDSEIKELIVKKYGDAIYDPHHWEKDGVLYPSVVPGAKAISNWEYEMDKNEKKRKIRVIYPELVSLMEKEAKAMFHE